MLLGIKVTTRNQDGRAGYTVASLSEVASPGPCIKNMDSNEEPGPSKKERLNWNIQNANKKHHITVPK